MLPHRRIHLVHVGRHRVAQVVFPLPSSDSALNSERTVPTEVTLFSTYHQVREYPVWVQDCSLRTFFPIVAACLWYKAHRFVLIIQRVICLTEYRTSDRRDRNQIRTEVGLDYNQWVCCYIVS